MDARKFPRRMIRVSGSLVSSAVALAVTPFVAHAQQATAQPGIEEIVVTAQRREENLQDVGISVTALGSEALTDLNITTATDITKSVPSLKMNAYSSAQVVFNIRGVSQNDYGDQQEPPVAVYQDDSYSSSINMASFPVFDLARVEVLRGPQGTLFGRNATGGAVQFVSNKPTKDLEGYATATVGSDNQWILEGAVSGPLGGNVQARLAAISNQDDGYIKAVAPATEDRGGNDHYAIRGQLAWQPSDATDLNLLVRYLKANKETQAGLYSFAPACPNDQFQGEFTRPDQSCGFWGTGPGEAGTGWGNRKMAPSLRRAAAAIPGRRRRRSDPTWIARSPAPRCTSTGTSATACTSSRSPTGSTARSSTSKAAMPRRSTACCSTRAATSTSTRRKSGCPARQARTRGWPAYSA